jgi:hypothetical protein
MVELLAAPKTNSGLSVPCDYDPNWVLEGRSFFPLLIAAPSRHGLHAAFDLATGARLSCRCRGLVEPWRPLSSCRAMERHTGRRSRDRSTVSTRALKVRASPFATAREKLPSLRWPGCGPPRCPTVIVISVGHRTGAERARLHQQRAISTVPDVSDSSLSCLQTAEKGKEAGLMASSVEIRYRRLGTWTRRRRRGRRTRLSPTSQSAMRRTS